MEHSNQIKPAQGDRPNAVLYPMVLAAAIAVTLFSAAGIATMTGWIPSARSTEAVTQEHAEQVIVTPAPAQRQSPPVKTRQTAPCMDCGVVESITAVQEKGEGSGVGAVVGGVVGGVLGNQVGGGRGRTVMTVAGAGAGAYAGHEVEKNMNSTTRYRVRVRMSDGSVRTFYEASPASLDVGRKVRATERGLVVTG